jgi:hypothetical protein
VYKPFGKCVRLVLAIIEVMVFSTDGKLVQSEANVNVIDISSLKMGAYTVQIALENGKAITKQIIKE